MRLLFSLLVSSLLCACGSTATDTAVLPPVSNPLPVTPPVVPLIANGYVQCGEFSLQAADNLPWTLAAPSDWVVLGSSSAAGAGATKPENSWAGLLRADEVSADAVWHNIARGGYTSYQALSESCKVDVLRKQPDAEHNIDKALQLSADLVLLSFPSNDAALGYPAVETAANILLLRQQLADENIALLVLSAQPRNMAADKQQQLVELNRLLKPVLTDCFVDIYASLAAVDGGLSAQYDFGDGVHLNDAGHQLVFDAIKQVLLSGKCVELP
ncbi:lysophospholipase L1-like esterase [Rheinheimera pacifica]|uniref:SGNH/GDSL hydrolase family protein n=1 Tax=Rheinheimera pacifica TaxID=173990 RepID=UPI00286407F6|nr:SGNH/GDSL hydrolase family protein [Rheinheimera pacifica]MDR6984052.1 lysophospholipase L1-like esterase [Rheinheimera pacifica]